MVTERVMIIKHYNTLNMCLEEIEKLVGEPYKRGLLYHRYTKNDIKEPYEPLISGIRYYYQKLFSDEMSVSEFIDKCNVYSLHKELFVSYIQNGCAHRTESGIVSEVKYEAGKFVDSIINCLSYIAKKTKLLIVLDKFQLAALSSVHIIDTIINTLTDYNIKILILYNELQVPYDYVEKEFFSIITKAEEKNILFEWESEEELISNDYRVSFIPNRRFFGDYILKLENLCKMFAIEDAGYYIDIINSRIAEEKLNISVEDKIRFYEISANCYILQNDNNAAMLTCDKMNTLLDENTDKRILYKYNYLCGSAQMLTNMSGLTYKYTKKCLEIANELNDEELILETEILINSIQFYGWKDVFSIDINKVYVPDEFINKLERYGYKNNLVYFTFYSYDNDNESIKRFIENGGSETYNKALSLAKEIGNTNALISAFSKYTVVFSDRGFIKNTDLFYDEKLKILKEDKNILRLVHTYMGIGYNYIIREQHNKANENFCKAIDYMYTLRDAEGLIEILYNMTINCFCAQDYMSSCYYIDAIFKMLNNLRMETIQICNAPKLYGIQALAYNIVGNEYRCFKCLNNIEVRLSHILHRNKDEEVDTYYWNEDLFLYYLVNAIIAKHNNDLEVSLEYFKEADAYYEKCKMSLFYVIVYYISEYYDLYKKLGCDDKANEILEMGLNYCRENSYVLKTQTLMSIIEGKSLNVRPISAEYSSVSIEQIVDLSATVGKERKLVEREKDITFLSILQETLNKDIIDKEFLINNTMISLQNNYNFDSIILIGNNNGKFELLYKDIIDDIDVDVDEIVDFFSRFKHDFIVDRTEKRFFSDFQRIVDIFGRNKIVSMVGMPIFDENGIKLIFVSTVNMHINYRRNRDLLPKEARVIIRTAVIQLGICIERVNNRKNIIEMNEKLNSLAITDMLTGLYNRQGLAKKIEEDYNSKNSVSILYADLDNFKYYNDTFGHDVGDVILVEFAKVFNKVAAKLGYAVRYGGDEFLVVLNNVSKEVICGVAEEIYETIKDGFVDVIGKYLNKTIDIPKDKLVSCSIGIATSDYSSGEGFADTLKKADQALYYMKKNHKGGYILWENLDEQENN